MKVTKLFLHILVFNFVVVPVFAMDCPKGGWVRAAIDCVFGNIRANLMFFDDNGDPALHAYARQGDIASIKTTLEGVDKTLGREVVLGLLGQLNSRKKTPLQVALECEQQGMAQLFGQYLS